MVNKPYHYHTFAVFDATNRSNFMPPVDRPNFKTTKLRSRVISGTPTNGTLLWLFPYHSHIFGDSYGSGMGIVWERGPNIGGP